MIRYFFYLEVAKVATATETPPVRTTSPERQSMIINCTPHSVDIYRPDAPSIVSDDGRFIVELSLPPSGNVARITEEVIPGQLAPRVGAEAALVVFVEYGHVTGLPDVRPKTWYLVNLPVALALPARRDLLVGYRQVRNAAGAIVGCRALAAPR
jgi:hypothetical protein